MVRKLKKNMKSKAGVVLYKKDGNGDIGVLLISARRYKNSWVFPVGTVEEHETLQVAAARECKEESGYIVEIEDEVGTVKTLNKDGENYYTFYKAGVLHKTDEYEKDRTIKWVKLDELPGTVAEVFRPIADAFIKGLKQVQ